MIHIYILMIDYVQHELQIIQYFYGMAVKQFHQSNTLEMLFVNFTAGLLISL